MYSRYLNNNAFISKSQITAFPFLQVGKKPSSCLKLKQKSFSENFKFLMDLKLMFFYAVTWKVQYFGCLSLMYLIKAWFRSNIGLIDWLESLKIFFLSCIFVLNHMKMEILFMFNIKIQCLKFLCIKPLNMIL